MTSLIAARKAELESGAVHTKNLAECLIIEQAALMRAVLPALGFEEDLERVVEAHRAVRDKGISHQIAAIGGAIGEALLERDATRCKAIVGRLTRHPSDTVRSWAVFAVTRADSGMTLSERLNAARPFAADGHFGVREWAWMAVRPFIAAQVEEAIRLLRDWTASTDPNVRRFTVESTRPRGVWCEHIGVLKSDPAIAAPLLEPLRADTSRYVQDSVANWLNDASKSSPGWVIQLCDQWRDGGNATTERIITRALRSLKKAARLSVPKKTR